MEYQEAKDKFIQSWGTLGSEWGINRTMAQIHALLMISPDALSAEDIMDELQISRGNANMNLRALIDWGLVHKELRPGNRREYFIAERDMWTIIRQIVIHRRKRELEPMLKAIQDLSEVNGNSPQEQQFLQTINDIKLFASKADALFEMLIHSEAQWFVSTFMRLLK